MAAEVFAEYFADDAVLRKQIMDSFSAYPGNMPAAAALAELVLRKPEPQLADFLEEKIRGQSFDVATHFKLVAALAPEEYVTDELQRVMTANPNEIAEWHLQRSIPAIVRRTERDVALRARLEGLLTAGSPAAVKTSVCARC